MYCEGADIAQSQLDGLSQRKVAERLTIKAHECRQEDICTDRNTLGAKLFVIYAYNVHSNNCHGLAGAEPMIRGRTIRALANLPTPLLQRLFLLLNMKLQRVEHRLSA